MHRGVEQSVRLGSVFFHEDVAWLRGRRKFYIRSFLSVSFEWCGLWNYNTKASKGV